MRRCSFLLGLLLLLTASPALGRHSPRNLSPYERAQVRREIRAKAQWHFALFEGRQPSLRTVIRPVRGAPNRFTASAEITAIWRGARTTLADNQFTITRPRKGKVTVTSPTPFIPR